MFDLPAAAVAYPAQRLPSRSAFDAPLGAPAMPPAARVDVLAMLLRPIAHAARAEAEIADLEPDPASHGVSVSADRMARPIAHAGRPEADPADLGPNPASHEAVAACSGPGIPYRTPTSGTQRQSRRGKRKTGSWSTEALESAIAAIESGAKIKTTARYYDIPASSLIDYLYGRTLSRKRGPPTIFTK